MKSSFSFRTSVTTEYDSQKARSRAPGRSLIGLPYQSIWRALSKRTPLMRIADAFALFVSRGEKGDSK